MRLKHATIFFLLLFLVFIFEIDGKRGGMGARRGGSVTKRLSIWTRRSRNKDSSRKHQKPPGWNPEITSSSGQVLGVKSGVEGAGGNKAAAVPPPPGWKIDNKPNNNNNQNKPPPYSAVDPNANKRTVQQNNAAPPAYPGNPPPPYPGNTHGLYPAGNPPPYPGTSYGYGNTAGAGTAYNPQNPFPGYYPTSNIGVIPPRGANHGQYYNSMSGMGGQNPYFVNQQNTGLMGPFIGGGGGGGGYGYGGYSAGYGYPVKKSGFFSGNAFRNVIAGMFIWHLVSGFTSRPYHVYSHYNRPEHQEEIKLPPNLLTVCNENATTLCAPSTIPLCTTNNTILCVTTMNAASPCAEGQGLCVNSNIPCADIHDPLCQNKTNDNSATVNLPCFTNMTLQGDFAGVRSTINIPESEGNKYCVTTMAVPDESISTNANYTVTKEIINNNNNATEINNVTVSTVIESTTTTSSVSSKVSSVPERHLLGKVMVWN